MAQKIEARFIIQIGGKPLENVEKALKVVLKKLEDEKKFKLIESDIGEAELDEKSTLYLGFLDVLVKFDDPRDILEFIVDYTPTSVEVESPDNIKMNNDDLTAVLNDMSNFILKAGHNIRSMRAQMHVMQEQLEKSKKK